MQRLDDKTLRRGCAELWERFPMAPAMRDIAYVGALRCVPGGNDADSIRMTRTLDYLLRSDVVISPDFEIDVINLFHGRDFLAEDKAADLVFVSFIPNVDHRLFPKLDDQVLQRQRGGSFAGKAQLKDTFFWQTRSPRHTTEAWRQRVAQTGAKLLVCVGGKYEIGTPVFARTSYVPLIPTPEFGCQPPYRAWAVKELYGGTEWDVPFKWLGLLARRDYLKHRPDPKRSPPRTMLAAAMGRRSKGSDPP